MSTQTKTFMNYSVPALLINSFKRKRSISLLSLSVLTLFLASCIGTSNVPVNYVNPVSGGSYELNDVTVKDDFDPVVEFPNGVPASPIIELNGIDVTGDFNCSGTTCTVDVVIGDGAGEANDIFSALRDGRNSFQVSKPSKDVIFFNLDFPGAEVHFISIDDGWDGGTFTIDRSCGGDVCTSTVNGVNVANRIYTPKRGNIIVSGYIDGEEYSNVSRMCVNTYTLTDTGVVTALDGVGNGYAICDSVAAGATYEGSYYVDFGDASLTTIGTFELGFTDGGGNGAPPAGGYQYSPTDPGGIWTFSGAVVTANATAWGVANAPQGNEAAGMQGTGSMSRSITVSAAGTYNLNFFAAQRNASNQQVVEVRVDGVPVSTFEPSGAAYEAMTVTLGELTAGTYTLSLHGTNPYGGDNTAFVDDMSISLLDGTSFTFDFNIRDTGDNDRNFNENEVDIIEITVTDSSGTYSTKWLRSNVPLWDSRVANSKGGLSLSFDYVGMWSTGKGVTDLLNGLVLLKPNDASDDLSGSVAGIAQYLVEEIYLGNDTIFNISIPNVEYANQGRIDIDANLEMRIKMSVSALGGWVQINCNTATINDFVPYNADVYIAIDKGWDPYIPNVTMANQNIDLSALDGLCGDVAGSGLVEDIITPIIENTVGGIIANDIPTMRAKIFIDVPDGLGSNDFGPYYMTVHPELTDFYAQRKGGTGSDTSIKWGMQLGTHIRGVSALNNPEPGSRNPSMGIKWNGIPDPADKALHAETAAQESIPAQGTTLGVTLTEDMVNQVLLGLWESGLVYFDFAFGGAGAGSVLDNLRFTFATRQPWEIDIYPDGTAAGDAQLYFPDLVIELLADSPYQGITDYNIATMVADIYFNVNLDGAGDALRIEVADTLQIDVKEVSSSWDNTTEDELIYALDQVFGQISAGLTLDLPFPEILSSAVDIKGVYSPDGTSLNVPIDVYNTGLYPNGPDGSQFAVTYANINGGTSNYGYRNLVNGVDDNPASYGMEPFRFYSSPSDRTYSNVCISGYDDCDTWGCTWVCTGYQDQWDQASFNWGFRHYFSDDFTLSGLTINNRNDGGASWAQGVNIRAYNNGAQVANLGTITNTGGGTQTFTMTPAIVDEVRFLVRKTCTSNAGDAVTGSNKCMGTAGGGNMFSFTEVTYHFE